MTPAVPPPSEPDAAADFSAAAVALTQQLVRLRTVNRRDGENIETPAAELVAEVMRDFGWQVDVVEVAPGRPNVIAQVHGRRPGRTLMFEGHTDVVTEGDRAAWSFDPYSGDIVDGKLRGRGSADMKSGVAAMIQAARAVEQAGFDGRIVLGVLCDEEEGMLGATAFAASEVARSGIDGVIVCEPEGGEICPIAKGALRIKVDLHGVMAHGAMPQHGRNPIPAVGRLLLGLGELADQIAANIGDHPVLGRFTVTPTVLSGGSEEQVNVIPSTASVFADIRTIPGVAHHVLVDLIGRLADQIATESGLTATVQVLVDRPVVETPVDHPVVQALAAAHRDITGTAPVFGGVPGTTDGTVLTRDAGLRTVVYGPGGKWIAHQADEYVDVADIHTAVRVYARAAELFLAGQPDGNRAEQE
ncbi:M20 family metallopeptidase [Nakamurella aerolata]|uniref:Probable succinyl-diaminopimelate desuccinylase n=1 Tax=Nakamurella aerolata TaxID=1656892 RepID=A0A849ABS0_9ACTN|nr:M20 family metallopeptidase [Nakamurella aerolata]NNG34342.1 M20 family metallopeptidase [Nakamurella aerolata]